MNANALWFRNPAQSLTLSPNLSNLLVRYVSALTVVEMWPGSSIGCVVPVLVEKCVWARLQWEKCPVNQKTRWMWCTKCLQRIIFIIISLFIVQYFGRWLKCFFPDASMHRTWLVRKVHNTQSALLFLAFSIFSITMQFERCLRCVYLLSFSTRFIWGRDVSSNQYRCACTCCTSLLYDMHSCYFKNPNNAS